MNKHLKVLLYKSVVFELSTVNKPIINKIKKKNTPNFCTMCIRISKDTTDIFILASSMLCLKIIPDIRKIFIHFQKQHTLVRTAFWF